jgi:hypothetical protein
LRLRVGVEVHPLSEGRQSESLIWHGWCFECNAGHALNHATRMVPGWERRLNRYSNSA